MKFLKNKDVTIKV